VLTLHVLLVFIYVLPLFLPLDLCGPESLTGGVNPADHRCQVDPAGYLNQAACHLAGVIRRQRVEELEEQGFLTMESIGKACHHSHDRIISSGRSTTHRPPFLS
jgi:hypothetical protein